MKNFWKRFDRQNTTGQSGNIFFTLFGAVTVVGAVGAGSMALLQGPVGSMVKINQVTVVETRAELNLKLMMHTASTVVGDCDSDGTLEATPWRSGTGPKNGGLIPSTIDTTTTDPWGSQLGYCVWDHGSTTMDPACGAGANRLAGANSPDIDDEAFVVVVSAGADRVFQTTCNAWVDTTPADGNPDTSLVQKAQGSDDIVVTYTYDGLRSAMGDNWLFTADSDSGTDTVLGTDMNVDLDGDVSFGGVLDLDKLGGGLVLSDKPGSCTAGIDNHLFRDTSSTPPSIVICTGGSFETVSGAGGVSTPSSDPDFDPENANCLVNSGGPFVEAGSFDTPASALEVWGDGTYVYVADAWSGGIRAYTFDGSAFTEEGWLDTPGWAYGVWGDGTYIYVADHDSGVQAYTFDGTSFTQEGTYDTAGSAYGVWGDGTYIYIADYLGGLRAYTFNGSTFTEVGHFNTPGATLAVWGDGTYIYAAAFHEGLRAYTFDGSTFTEVGHFNTPDASRGVWGDGTYIYVAERNSGVQAYTFDGTVFTQVASDDTPGEASWVWGDGTYFYVSDGVSGVHAYEFNGSSFTHKDTYDTPHVAQAVWGDGTYIYIADGDSGIHALSGFECTTAYKDDPNDPNIVAYAWGDDTNGKLGNGAAVTIDQSTPDLIDGYNFVQIDAGDSHSCGLQADGAAYCWGRNNSYQLGDGTGTTTDQHAPVQVSGIDDFVQISAGWFHTCGVTNGGKAYCWGGDTNGRLGNGTTLTASQDEPSQVHDVVTFKQISAADQHTCGVTSDGKAYCWGNDANGRLGNGAGISGDQAEPSQVSSIANFVQISAGYQHTCGVTSDGKAYCWGNDGNGRLGNGASTSGDQAEPTQVLNIENFIQISAGNSHTCGLTSDGKAYCWGTDNNLRLGDGASYSGTTNEEPVEVANINDFIKIRAGQLHTCGLTSSGELYCWGSENDGRLGNGSTSGDEGVPVLVSAVTNFVDFDIRNTHTVALAKNTIDGNQESPESPYEITQSRSSKNTTGSHGLSVQRNAATAGNDASIGFKVDLTSTGSGDGVSAAIKASRQGAGGYGGLGFLTMDTGAVVDQRLYVDPQGNVALKSAETDSYARLQIEEHGAGAWNTDYQDGFLVTRSGAGTNNIAYLGLDSLTGDILYGSNVNALVFSHTDDTGGSISPVMEVVDTGSSKFFGSVEMNKEGGVIQLDSYSNTAQDTSLYLYDRARGTASSPVAAQLGDDIGAVSFNAYDGSSYAPHGQANIWAKVQGTVSSGNVPTQLMINVDDGGANMYAESNALFSVHEGGEVTILETTPQTLFHVGGRGASDNGVKVSNDNDPCTNSEDEGTLRYIGSSWEYCDGSSWVPWTAGGGGGCTSEAMFHGLASGQEMGCGLFSNGRVACWGNSSGDRLGNQLTDNPVEDVIPTNQATLNNVQVLGGFSRGGCALMSDGRIKCWGENNSAQLGRGFFSTSEETPGYVLDQGYRFTYVTGGYSHNCGIVDDGRAMCWGSGFRGKLGTGSSSNQLQPAFVSGLSNVTAISAGDRNSCAITSDRKAWCWGQNGVGELGNGSLTGDELEPVEVSGLTDVVDIDVGGSSDSEHFACAAKLDGTVWCWGSDNYGQLGNGATSSNQSSPVQVNSITDIVDVDASASTACALKNDGTVWCWGRGHYGQLGNGSTTATVTTPVQVSGITNAAALGNSNNHSYYHCAILQDGEAKCWGRDSNAQIGDGSGAGGNISTPVNVVNPYGCSASCTPGSQSFTATGMHNLVIDTTNRNCTYTITVEGAGGGTASGHQGGAGGGARFDYAPGSTGVFNIYVGEGGAMESGGDPGTTYAGGGAASDFNDGSGGGASAVTFDSTLLAVSGGGGGATSANGGEVGGAGGSQNACGGDGAGPAPGLGGCNNIGGAAGGVNDGSGGAGGSAGADGSYGLPHSTNKNDSYAGGNGLASFGISGGGAGGEYNGGGGGGGYGGGGGGASQGANGSGGGGGGYIDDNITTNRSTVSGASAGNDGSVTFSWN